MSSVCRMQRDTRQLVEATGAYQPQAASVMIGHACYNLPSGHGCLNRSTAAGSPSHLFAVPGNTTDDCSMQALQQHGGQAEDSAVQGRDARMIDELTVRRRYLGLPLLGQPSPQVQTTP